MRSHRRPPAGSATSESWRSGSSGRLRARKHASHSSMERARLRFLGREGIPPEAANRIETKDEAAGGEEVQIHTGSKIETKDEVPRR